MKNTYLLILMALLTLVSCKPKTPAQQDASCAESLIAYTKCYPASEPQDLYKLVFQDNFGPGHLITDSASCAGYIEREVQSMADSNGMPLYEYTLCGRHYVRVNLLLVRRGVLSVQALTSAVLRSAENMPTVDSKYVVSHSTAFKQAYDPHYRIVRRDIFESEILPLLDE